jgi:hypothetical protein
MIARSMGSAAGSSPTIHRSTLIAGTVGIVLALDAPRALPAGPEADDPWVQGKAACVAAYEAGQRARAAGHFRAARVELVTCARTACPPALQKDCTRWLGELDDAQPTIVLAVGKGGADLQDVRVLIDGRVATERLTGSALPIDPGEHKLRFEHGEDPPVEQVLVVREGEKARRIDISFGAPTARAAVPPPKLTDPSTSRPTPGATYVAMGVGGAGLVAFGVLAGYGLSQKSALDACRPSCPQSQVDAAAHSFDAADIALTAGVFSLGWAAVFYFTRPERLAPTAAGEAPAWQVGLVPGGAVVDVAGRF